MKGFGPLLQRNTLAMVLAGGQGERLYPLTRDRPKPAIPFGGSYRIIDFTLSNCLNANIRRIYVLTQYKSDFLNRHLRRAWDVLHEDLGEFIYSVPPQLRTGQRWYQGTADAIFQNIYILQKERPKRVLILAGDHIYKMDYSQLLAFHLDNQADLTIACRPVDLKEGQRLGILDVDSHWRVIGFQEKPQHPHPLPGNPQLCLASLGVYAFNTPVLVRSVSEDAKQNTSHDFGQDIIPRLIGQKRVFAYNFVDKSNNQPQYWRDIGTIDSYWETNMDLVAVNPDFNLYDQAWPIHTYQEQCPPAKIVRVQENLDEGKGMVLHALISGGCFIRDAHIERSVLSPRVHIHHHVQICETVLMEDVEVGPHARIRRAIIDQGVHIPRDMEIGFDEEKDRKKFVVTEGGIVVVPQGMPLEETIS